VVGGYVFNAGIDLCSLLWRIGRAFDRPHWCEWAREAALARIQRDINSEGWIHAEDGGVSGYYQLLGAKFIARFAWESQIPELRSAVLRIFAEATLPYATSGLDWPGNLGTRIGHLSRVPPELLLAAAAFGDARAAELVHQHAQPEWEGDLALWRAALRQPREAAQLPAVVTLPSVSGTIIREGPWTAYFGDYEKAVWARGFTNLHHELHRDWVFSTLHSLTGLASSLQAKARLGDTTDWAGFPHVRVQSNDAVYDSHQRIATLSASSAAEGVVANWSEPLLSRSGEIGGEMHARFHFHGETIDMTLELRDVVGELQIDYHFLRRANGFSRLWIGDEVAAILTGRLLFTPGHFDSRTLRPGQSPLYAVQVDRTVFAFEVLEAPAGAQPSLFRETPQGLHTGNLGGFRFRIEVPFESRSATLKLRLRAINPRQGRSAASE
jgi:hypothetical protein